MKMNGILAYEAVRLNLPQTNIWCQLSHMLTPNSLISPDGDHLSSVLSTDYSALLLRSQSMCWCQRGEQHAWRKGMRRRKREEGRCWGKWKSITYIQTACLAGYPSGTASHFLLTSPPPSSSSSSSQHFTCSISRMQHDYKTKKKKTASAYNWTKHQTENDKTHTRRDNPNPSPILDFLHCSFSLPAPCNLNPQNIPFSKNILTWIKHKSKNWSGCFLRHKDF